MSGKLSPCEFAVNATYPKYFWILAVIPNIEMLIFLLIVSSMNPAVTTKVVVLGFWVRSSLSYYM